MALLLFFFFDQHLQSFLLAIVSRLYVFKPPSSTASAALTTAESSIVTRPHCLHLLRLFETFKSSLESISDSLIPVDLSES